MTIIVGAISRDRMGRLRPSSTLDFLPIIRMRHRNADFSCTLVTEMHVNTEPRKYIRGDIKILKALINHESEAWRSDISSGKIAYVGVGRLGAKEMPYVQILISHGHEEHMEYVTADDHYSNGYDWEYLRRVGLGDIWKSEVDGEVVEIDPMVRRWDTEDETPDRDPYAYRVRG